MRWKGPRKVQEHSNAACATTDGGLANSRPQGGESRLAAAVQAPTRVGTAKLRGSSIEMQVATPQFQEWFGGSKMVLGPGEPLVVFHGTGAEFTTFDKEKRGMVAETSDSRLGFYFTTSRIRADQAAADASWLGHPRVLKLFLRVGNPLVVREPQGAPWETAAIIKRAKRRGHDGVVWEKGEMGGQDIIVFEPTQIKSATGNSGAFDPINPCIYD